MWGAFVTGFAEQASVEIEKTNKEISDRMIARMTDQIKKREEAEEIAETKRDTARKQAQALRELSGNKLTDTQIVGIINGTQADSIIKQLQDRQVGPERLKQLFIPADPNAQADLEQYLSEVGKLTGQAPAKEEMERGAFNLPTRAGKAASANLLAAYGKGREEVFQTTLVKPKGVEGTLNLNALAEEKEEDAPSAKELKDRLADLAADNDMTPVEYGVKTKEGAKILARIAGREMLGADDEKEKARTASQIRTLVRERLDEQLAPLQFKNIIYVPERDDYVSTIPGSPEALEVQRLRRNVATEVFNNAGLLRGNKVLNRDAADALSRYAVIDYDTLTLKSWRPVAGSRGGAEASPVPAPGGRVTPTPTPTPAPTPTPTPAPMPTPTGAKPIPRDANGKPDRSKLVAGEKYASSRGEIRIWNGTSFQPAK